MTPIRHHEAKPGLLYYSAAEVEDLFFALRKSLDSMAVIIAELRQQHAAADLASAVPAPSDSAAQAAAAIARWRA